MGDISKKIIVGSRDSKLALSQTDIVIASLKDNYPWGQYEIVKIKTKGDKILNITLSKVGGKGLFVKEIEEALLQGKIDLAVHSMKDMPYELPQGLEISAVTRREDPRDVFISAKGDEFMYLRKGSLVGTSSLRRASQLKTLRPDIEIRPLRGNVLTRIEKMKQQGLDGIVLAAAGIKRLGLESLITHYFSIEEIIPAVGQGALAVESRIGDEIVSHVKVVNHPETAIAVKAERSFMKTLGGSCQIPIGAFAQIHGETMEIIGMLDKNGKVNKDSISGPINQGEKMGIKLAEKLGEM